MSETPPEPESGRRRAIWDRVSVIWLIPLVALVIALGVAWRNWANRGPLIEITFNNASGISADETELRFRDVRVGVVEDVSFSDTLQQVIVSVRLEENIAPYVDENAAFWVVRPEVTTRGVTGLNTVLSGAYIEGLWDDEAGQEQRRFDGRAEAPLVRPGKQGLKITLRSSAGEGFTDETPIFYRGIEVGRLGQSRIAENGDAAVADAVIYEPHDRLVTSATRFWDTSGFTFSLGANGATIDFTSFAALLSGGISFETTVSGGEPVADGATFVVYPSQQEAESSAFDVGAGTAVKLTAIFSENVSGLDVGAPVELRGVKVGQVSDISGLVDAQRFGDSKVRLLTTLVLRPGALGLPDDADSEQTLDYLAKRVRAGLRARLASASVLTGGLNVELALIDDAEAAQLDRDADPHPVIPTAASNITDVAASAKGVLERVSQLPIEEVMASTVSFLDAATQLISSEDVQQTPAEVRGLLADARSVVGADQVQTLPGQISGLVSELERTTSDLRGVIADLSEARLAQRLTDALEAAETAGDGAASALEGVPPLLDRLEAVAARAEDIPITELTDELSQILDTADGILATQGAKKLPGSLASALDEMADALAELREGGTVAKANQTLAAAADAADSLSQAAGDLPAVVQRLNTLIDQARSTLQDYDQDSDVARQLQTALREVQRAADAVSSLARTLERDPNSLLLGR